MINPFSGDGFTLAALTAAINNAPYKPGLLGSLGVFTEDGITSNVTIVESENGVLQLVSVAPRNGVPTAFGGSNRTSIPFAVPHLPAAASVFADEVLGVRVFGSEDQAEMVQDRVNSKLENMRNSLEYTLEAHRLVTVKGNYINSNGDEVSLATTFGVSPASTVDFALDVDATNVRSKCGTVLDEIEEGLGGLSFDGVIAICGKTFWSRLIDHPSLQKTVEGWEAAQSLREDPRQEIEFGGIRFIRYRGNSSVKVDDNEAHAFPTGVIDFLITRFAPANYAETVNTKGIPLYAKSAEMEFNKGVKLEAQTNPLNLATRPAALVKLTV